MAPASYMLARMCHDFPGMPFVSPSYPTEDHVVPVRWMDTLWMHAENVMAVQQLLGTYSVAHGTKMVQPGVKDPEFINFTERLKMRAFPSMKVQLLGPPTKDPDPTPTPE